MKYQQVQYMVHSCQQRRSITARAARMDPASQPDGQPNQTGAPRAPLFRCPHVVLLLAAPRPRLASHLSLNFPPARAVTWVSVALGSYYLAQGSVQGPLVVSSLLMDASSSVYRPTYLPVCVCLCLYIIIQVATCVYLSFYLIFITIYLATYLNVPIFLLQNFHSTYTHKSAYLCL